MWTDELLTMGVYQAWLRETDDSVLPLVGLAVLLVGHVSLFGFQTDAPSIPLRFCAVSVRRVVDHCGWACGRGGLFFEPLTLLLTFERWRVTCSKLLAILEVINERYICQKDQG